jgi:hypothetical protein
MKKFSPPFVMKALMRCMIAMISLLIAPDHAARSQTLNSLAISYSDPIVAIVDQTTDAQGNIYYQGFFNTILTINGEELFATNGGYDLFLVKTDSEGSLIWAKNYGGVYNEQCAGSGGNFNLILEKDGYLYVIWQNMTPLASFGSYVNNTGNRETVFAKMDATTGEIVWYRSTSFNSLRIFDGGDSWFLMGSPFYGGQINNGYYDGRIIAPNIEYLNFLYIIKTDSDGNYQSLRKTTLRLDCDIALESGKRFYIFSKKGESHAVTFGDQVDQTIVPDVDSYQYIALRTDTSFASISYRVFTKIYENDYHTGFSVVCSAVSNDSTYLVINSDDRGRYLYDGFDVPVGTNNILVVLGNDLLTQRVSVLNSNNQFQNSINRLSVKKISVFDESLYLHLFFTGKNNSLITDYPEDYAEVDLFSGAKQMINLNGSDISYLVRSNLGLNAVTVDSLTNRELNYINADLAHQNYTFTTNQISVWDPWIITENSNILIGTGRFFDRPDNIQKVMYLSDGTRYFIGISTGRSQLDPEEGRYKLNGGEIFVARVNMKNEVMWYKKSNSSYIQPSIVSAEVVQDKMYLQCMFGNSLVKGFPSIFELGGQVISDISSDQLNLIVEVSPDGTIDMTELNSILTPVQQPVTLWRVLSVSGDRTALVCIPNDPYFQVQHPLYRETVINGKTFPSTRGLLIGKIDLETRKFTDAIKIYAPNASINYPINVIRDPVSNDYILSGVFYINTTSPVVFQVHNGSAVIDEINMLAQTASTSGAVSHGLLFRFDFEKIKWHSEWTRNGNRGPFAIKSDTTTVIYLIKHSGEIVYNGTKLEDRDNGGSAREYLFSLLKIGNSGKLLNWRYFPGFEANLLLIEQSAQKILLSGTITNSCQIGSISISDVGGLNDAITVQVNDTLGMDKVYQLKSLYTDAMNSVSLYKDSLISFAYYSQGNPELIIHYPDKPAAAGMLKSGSIALNPADKEPEPFVAQVVIGCQKKIWFEDADGDGYGNPDKSAEACHQPLFYVANNLDCDDTEPTAEPCPCPERTLSGGWTTSNKNNPLTDEWFIKKFPDNLVVGGTDDQNRSLTLTSARAARTFLSSTGKPSRLERSYTDPKRDELANAFARHLVMLRLNMALNPGLKKAVISRGYFANSTVLQLFNRANDLISSVVPVSASDLSAYSNACDSVNLSFEKVKTGYVVCETEAVSAEKAGILQDAADNLQKVIFYPNPSKGAFTMYNSTDEPVNITIYRITGEIIEKHVNVGPGDMKGIGNRYTPGLYIAIAEGAGNYREIFKLVKN